MSCPVLTILFVKLNCSSKWDSFWLFMSLMMVQNRLLYLIENTEPWNVSVIIHVACLK